MTRCIETRLRQRCWPTPSTSAMAGLLALALAAPCPGAFAAPTGLGSTPGAWTIGLLGGEAVNHSLPDLLPKVLRGDLDFEPAHLAGLLVRRAIEPPSGWTDWGRRHDIGVSTSLDLSLLQAGGLARNTEIAFDWRPAIAPWQWGPLTLELAWGLGVSHSMGRPWSDYTDPDRPQGHRTLFHMAPELAFQHTALPDWSLSLRLHHRSGLYGLFGPRRVGSNHLALTVMHGF